MTVAVRRLRGAMGAGCPICLLAGLVAVLLLGSTAGLVLLDRGRSFEQAELAAQHVVELARQRSFDLMLRLDASLRLAAEAAGAEASTRPGAAVPGGAAQAGLDRMLAQRRRGESGMLGLYLVNSDGRVVAGSSATGFGIGALVPLCLRDQRVEEGQLALTRIGRGGGRDPMANADQPTAAEAAIVCAVRGVGGGAVVAMLAPDLFQSQYADLALGPHGTVSLRDEVGRLLARTGAGGGPAPVDGEAASSEDARFAPPSGIVLRRPVAGPVAAVVTIALTRGDILFDWWYRSVLLVGSGLIVVGFVGLAVQAVRRCERSGAARLARLGVLADAWQGAAEPQAAGARLRAAAAELVPCTAIDPGDDDQDGDWVGDGDGEGGFAVSLQQGDRVRIGSLLLQRDGGAGFSPTELATLRLLARLAEIGRQQAAAVTKLQQAVARSRAEADRLSTTQETLLLEMSDASFTLDANWRITATNRNADRLFGEYAEDVVGRSVWEVFPELVGTVFDSECRGTRNEGHQAAFDLLWARSDDWLAVRVFPRVGGVAVYMQDVSARSAADDKLREAAKMDAIGRLTGGIAHDFNNLLTVVLGNVEMLEQELPDTGEIREMHDQIRRAAQTAARLTHQLLAFARRQPLSPVEVDVGRLIGGLEGLLRREMGSGITLEIAAPATLWHARVDPAQLEAAVLHLANNAREAMPLGGRLTIACANLAVRKPDIDQFGEIRPGNYVMISLSDTGRGIAKDVLGQVFDPFFSTKPSGRGTGLGLSMVYGFATQSGGHARVASEPGRGATVRLYLPSTTVAAEDPVGARRLVGLTKPGCEPALPGGQESVLVVEDSDMVRDYARAVLEGLGYTVRVAGDAAAALALLDQGLQPDLLLSDVLLPSGMNGTELADAVLRRRPGLPVLFMSGFVEDAGASGHARLDPGINLLMKPFRRASLAAMVRVLLDRARAS